MGVLKCLLLLSCYGLHCNVHCCLGRRFDVDDGTAVLQVPTHAQKSHVAKEKPLASDFDCIGLGQEDDRVHFPLSSIIQIKKTILPETSPPCTERLCEDDRESNNVSNVSDDDDDDNSPIDVHMSEVVTAATMTMMAAPPTWIPYNI